MNKSEESVSDGYTDVDYLQFSPGSRIHTIQACIGMLLWPLALPLAFIARQSDILFRAISEFLSLVPYFPGVILRYEFYRFALKSCGKNVLIEFGAVFIYRDIEIGDNVLIGRYCIVHHCDFEDYALVGERCTFLSGSKQHTSTDTTKPMALQGGQKKRIKIHRDCWIGSHSVVMESVATGSIVAAGSVVTKPVDTMSIVAGSPAKLIRKR